MISSARNELFDVSGRTVVITGACGRLGRRYVEFFVTLGAKVAALDVVPFDVSKATAVLSTEADVADVGAIRRAYTEIVTQLGEPHVLINNAALDFPPDLPAHTNGNNAAEDSNWVSVLEVNLRGVVNCCQVFGEGMAAAGRGSIVNVGSIYGIVAPDPALYSHLSRDGTTFIKPVSYVASKSALPNMSAHLAVNLVKRGVRVNTLTLGGVLGNQDDEFIRKYSERIPAGRMADADDYFGALTFLASDASRYVIGANIVVDGGWTAI